jgi:hypothetical protein
MACRAAQSGRTLKLQQPREVKVDAMRKRIIGQADRAREPRSEARWLDLERLAEVEVTSEDPSFPIESALALQAEGQGWRAAEPGEQLVRIVFDAPTAVHRIRLEFVETKRARTQEFVLRWAAGRNEPFREIVRQQWTFSPDGSTREIEDYEVDLADLGVLELAIKPEISGGDALASLAAWRVA